MLVLTGMLLTSINAGTHADPYVDLSSPAIFNKARQIITELTYLSSLSPPSLLLTNIPL